MRFFDKESPCGSTKTGEMDAGTTTWDCGCLKMQYMDGDWEKWCGHLQGKVYRELPGVWESFTGDMCIAGKRNGQQIYKRND